jgi:O-antigen biosynthesis protein
MTKRTWSAFRFGFGRKPIPIGAGLWDRFEADDEGWLRNAGVDPKLVLLTRKRPIRPGWFEVTLEGVEATQFLAPVIAVTSDPGAGATSAFPLYPVRSGTLTATFLAERPIHRITLDLSAGSARFKVGALSLHRIGRASIIAAAIRRDPVEAASALGWGLLGKKLRATNRLRRLVGLSFSKDYADWLVREKPGWLKEAAQLLADLERLPGAPIVSVIVPVGESPNPDALGATLASIEHQSYGRWELILAGVAGATGSNPSLADPSRARHSVSGPATGRLADDLNAGLAIAAGRLVTVVAPGDRLADGALARLADAAVKQPSATIVYGDDDRLDGSGRHSAPWMKPDWNRELFLASDYVGRAVAFDRARAAAAGGWRDIPGAETFDLVLRLAAENREVDIAHVPRVLLHLDGEGSEAERASAPEARRRAVAEALAAQAPDATATLDERGLVRILRPLPSPAPRVSLLIPTRDRVDLLRPCIDSLRERTDYPDLEILVVDNGSTDPATLQYFRRLARDERVRVLPYAGPFNFSAINNFAAREATGSVLGLINNDIETIHPDWLAEMTSQALRPEIGAVGAKLLYPSDLVQHAGVVIGLGGLAGHAHRFYPAEHPGQIGRLQAAQFFAAVTAACLVVERRKFDEVEGLNEEAFPVAFNDVDFCLRLYERGYRNLYTPYARLYHKESASRASDRSRREIARFRVEAENLRRRWSALIAHDPHYSPNLTRAAEDFSLS